MEPTAGSGGDATVVAPAPVERALVWVGFPLIGAGAGWLLKALAGWATSLPWVPFQGPLELVASIPDPSATIGSLALGIVAGLVVAVLAERDYVRVTWVPGGDPHKDEYRRWVEDLPELPTGANAILRARAPALERGDTEDAAQLRRELGKLGIVVREEAKRQSWRRTRRQTEQPDDEPTP